MSSLQEMTVEVREVNTALGWRTGGNTLGDYLALIVSEVSEALEAYRDHRLADATEVRSCWPVSVPLAPHDRHAPNCQKMPKPEGVGNEFADVLIRVIDVCDIYSIDLPTRIAVQNWTFNPNDSIGISDVLRADVPDWVDTFGDAMTWLGRSVFACAPGNPSGLVVVLSVLCAVADKYDVDLAAEYERKIAYNRTRPYQHGGRTLNEATPRRTHAEIIALGEENVRRYHPSIADQL